MPPPPSNLPLNTVRMKAAELQKLHEELEAASRSHQHARKSIRLEYVQMAVRVEMHQGGGATTNLHYAARNISGDGMGILHNSYVHPNTRCIVYLKHREGREVGVEAAAVRCRHVKGLIHEVGLRFKERINVRDYLNVDPMEGRFTMEAVDPRKLNGSILHVDDSPMDRRLVRHFLADTALNIVTVEDAKTALERSGEEFDALIVDNDLSDMPGVKLVEQLRAKGIEAPIIMLTADARPATKEAARAARVSAVLAKPTTKESVLQALAEFLMTDNAGSAEAGGAVVSSLSPADPTFKFVTEFVEELKGFAEKINKAVAAADVQATRRLAYQIKGAAPALGFASIGEAANAVMLSLDATGGVNECGKQVRNLVAMCLRAKVRDENAKDQRKAG